MDYYIIEGEVALKTDFDVEALNEYLIEQDIPAYVSYFAGTYICNNTYFRCLKYIKNSSLKCEAVFVHVPLSPKEVNRMEVDAPSFPPELIANALCGFVENYHR